MENIKTTANKDQNIIQGHKGYTETFISDSQYEDNKQKGLFSTFLNHGRDFDKLNE